MKQLKYYILLIIILLGTTGCTTNPDKIYSYTTTQGDIIQITLNTENKYKLNTDGTITELYQDNTYIGQFEFDSYNNIKNITNSFKDNKIIPEIGKINGYDYYYYKTDNTEYKGYLYIKINDIDAYMVISSKIDNIFEILDYLTIEVINKVTNESNKSIKTYNIEDDFINNPIEPIEYSNNMDNILENIDNSFIKLNYKNEGLNDYLLYNIDKDIKVSYSDSYIKTNNKKDLKEDIKHLKNDDYITFTKGKININDTDNNKLVNMNTRYSNKYYLYEDIGLDTYLLVKIIDKSKQYNIYELLSLYQIEIRKDSDTLR